VAILFTDDFNRANNADVGASWDPNAAVGIGDGLKIVSNLAAFTTNNDTEETVNAISAPNNQYAEATLGTTTTSGVGAGYGIVCRSAGTAHTGYRLVGNASGYELARFNAGTITSLSSGSGTTFTTGDKIRLEVRTNGANCDWILKKNGTQFASGTDTSPIASGKVGITYSTNDATATGIDAFEAGDFTEGDGFKPHPLPDGPIGLRTGRSGLIMRTFVRPIPAPQFLDDSVPQGEFSDYLEATEHPDQADAAAFEFYASAPFEVVAVVDQQADVQLPPEWVTEESDEHPDYWSQAPPLEDDLPQQAIVEDASSQPPWPEDDESFGFEFFTLPANDLPQQGIVEDSANQPPEPEDDEAFSFVEWQTPNDDLPQQGIAEDSANQPPWPEDDEDYGFTLDRAIDDVAPDQIVPEDATLQPPDPEDEDYAFFDSPPPADFAPDQIFVELGNDALGDEDEFAEGFETAPLADDNDVGIPASFPAESEEPELEDFGFTIEPPPADIQSDQVFVECSETQPEDVIEEPEGFNIDGTPAEVVTESNQVFVEDASAQPDEPEDGEDYGLGCDPTPNDVAAVIVPPETIGSYGQIGLGPFGPKVFAIREPFAFLLPPKVEETKVLPADVVPVMNLAQRGTIAQSIEPVAKPITEVLLIRSETPQLQRTRR
jgi:hypothetical protein